MTPPPPDPGHRATPATETTPPQNAPTFGQQLTGWMEARGLRNVDLVRRMGGVYDRSLISQWKRDRVRPSDLAAMRIADALGLPAGRLLRAAGYDEVAERFEQQASPLPRDPTLELLDAVGIPELTAPIADDYRRDMAGAKRRAELELDELLRVLGRETPPGNTAEEKGERDAGTA